MAKRKRTTTKKKTARKNFTKLEQIKLRPREKRQTLLTKYQFEIGIVTFPVYLVFFLFGLASFGAKLGQAMIVIGIIGGIASTISIINGYKDIRF